MSNKYIIYTDGGARGNPGPAGIGVVIYNEDGDIVLKKSEYIGKQTNNQAEYHALIFGLNEALNLKAKSVNFYLDSELVTKQMRGEYRVKNKNIYSLYEIASGLANRLDDIKFIHVGRENNKEADLLVNKALNRARG